MPLVVIARLTGQSSNPSFWPYCSGQWLLDHPLSRVMTP
jgi:hypothetical protein